VPCDGSPALDGAAADFALAYDAAVTAPTVVILAAGQGTRMRSRVPKVLHDVCGRPMIALPVEAARATGAASIVVVDGPERPLDGHLPEGVAIAVQPVPDGTGGALAAALDAIPDGAPVLVLMGDVPLVEPDVLRELIAAHAAAGAAATVATVVLEDPGQYGRIVRDAAGEIERIVESKVAGDASPEELAIREINSGIYVFDAAALKTALPQVGSHNAQGERYLPDVLPLLRAAGGKVIAHVVDDQLMLLGVNDRVDLARVREIVRRRIIDEHLRAGVDIVDPASTVVDSGVELGPDTIVEPSTVLRGATRVGAGCRIGPGSTLIGAVVGEGVSVLHAYLIDCEVRDGVSVGPFAYLRPGTLLRERSKIGTFVEVKNSDIGEGSKVPHLSYLGDADVGPDSNLGAGSITANYDGRNKHRTTIGTGVRGSVHTSYVAPVTVGDAAWTAAGSVITDDVPPGALGVARERQRNIPGYDERRRREAESASAEAGGTAPSEDAQDAPEEART
jgi:bifunctional UDP-N-acetylglucosamine pyrophosphorylase/glucosamine-1-phosphate N-acetyltransferase